MDSRRIISSKKKIIFPILLFTFLYLLFNLLDPNIKQHPFIILIDVIILVIAVFGLCCLFSQFLLNPSSFSPLKQLQIFLWYLLRKNGPFYHLKNGVLNSHHSSVGNRKFSSLLIDTNSVAVIFTKDNVNSIKTGLHILYPSDSIFGFFSTDRQMIVVGPLSENPFASFNREFETQEAFSNRLRRRHETQAFTANGMEIVPNICFCLEIVPLTEAFPIKLFLQKPDLPHDISSMIKKHVLGSITDIWRQEVSRRKSSDIFSNERVANILSDIEQLMVNSAVKLELFDESGILKKLVQIRLLDLTVYNLRIQGESEDQMVKKWGTYWFARVQKEDDHLSSRSAFLEGQFHRKVQMKLAENISTVFVEELPAKHNSSTIASRLIASSLSAVPDKMDPDNDQLVSEISALTRSARSAND